MSSRKGFAGDAGLQPRGCSHCQRVLADHEANKGEMIRAVRILIQPSLSCANPSHRHQCNHIAAWAHLGAEPSAEARLRETGYI